MKGCIKRVFSNTIKKVMISLKKIKNSVVFNKTNF